FNDTATTEIYTLSLHDALPICRGRQQGNGRRHAAALGRCAGRYCCRTRAIGSGQAPAGQAAREGDRTARSDGSGAGNRGTSEPAPAPGGAIARAAARATAATVAP